MKRQEKELDRLRRELEEKAQQRLQQEEAEQRRREAAKQEPFRREQQELMQGRSIILDALDATSIQAVKQVPFSYGRRCLLAIRSNVDCTVNALLIQRNRNRT